MSEILTDLNKEQIEAVTHKEGPLLIIAGAGTGKTRVITRRIAWLIEQKIAQPQEMLALTFTDKSANEMQERVDILLPYGVTDIWISTFHAFGDRILRENALSLGLDPNFQVLSRPETVVFFREHLFDFNLRYFRPLSDPTRFIEALIVIFSRAKDEDISPEEYASFVQNLYKKSQENPQDLALKEEAEKQLEISACYAKFQELLLKEGKLDFGNQFYLALTLLRQHPAILKYYQEKFKYILVDEFQDTNFAQFQMLKLLAGKDKNITVVSDDDQCIFRFRGAAYSNILNFINEYPEAKKITLIQNYRSTQSILDSAYRLIQYNNPDRFEVKSNINKRLIGKSSSGPKPIYLNFDTVSSEADKVAEIILDKVNPARKDTAFSYQDFAILVRSNNEAQPFLQALNMKGIPWRFSGNQGLYQKEEVRLCISFLRFVTNLLDSLSLYYLASSEVYKISINELMRINNYSWRHNRELFWSFSHFNEIGDFSDLSDKTQEIIKKITADIDKFLELSRNLSAGQLLYRFLTDTGYIKYVVKQKTAEAEEKIKNIAQFFEIIKEAEAVIKQPTALEVTRYLDLLIEAGDDPQSANFDLDSPQVNVLTIHKAKGLEFRVVFMVGLVAGRFPTVRRKQELELPIELIKDILPTGDFHTEEERRLFYVGMTRAKEELYLTSSLDYGGKSIRKTSQFIFEALEIKKEEVLTKKTSGLELIRRQAPPLKSKESPLDKTKEKDILSLSYFQIDDYLSCPLKYKYVHILRVPILAHHTVIYGRALHEAVLRYYQHRMKNQPLSCAELVEIFRNSLQREGFLNRQHLEERLKVGIIAIERFFNEEEKNNKLPTYVEKDFSFSLGNNRIIGRWDRVDIEDDKSMIIDFKSSELNTQEAADKRAKESLQLSLYALAFKYIFGNMPSRVELHFLETGLVGSAVLKEENLEKTMAKIEEASCGIRDRDYTATPSVFVCTYCAYNAICPEAVSR